MKENQNCGHEQDEMCACIRDMSTANQMIHTAGNIRDVSWELDYETLEAPKRVRGCVCALSEAAANVANACAMVCTLEMK